MQRCLIILAVATIGSASEVLSNRTAIALDQIVTDVIISNLKSLMNSTFKVEQFNLTAQSQSNFPDVDRNATEVIQSRGFIAETHTVTTEDGYILTVFRIVNPDKNKARNAKPVLLQHGLFGNSDQFIIDAKGALVDGTYTEDNLINDCLSNKSVGRTLGFVLCDCGYDVWLGNTRGNRYSTAHRTLNPFKDLQYWSFNIDHLSSYDAKAMIDYILYTTKHKTMGYIGHSLGTTMIFQLLSSQPEYSNVIKPYIALAPVAYLSRTRATLISAAAILEQLVPSICSVSIPLFKFGQDNVQYFAKAICGNPSTINLCVDLIFLFVGVDHKNLDLSRMPAFFAPFPDATSSWVVCQLARRINRKSFAYFDYGQNRNKKIYGQTKPPRYYLSNINSTDMYLMSGVNDYLADPGDVAQLRSQLTVKHRSIVMKNPDFNHIDFVFGKSTGRSVNAPCLKILRKYYN